LTRHTAKLGLLGLLVWGTLVSPALAKDGYLSVTFTKAGLVGGVGAGHGVLTFEGREYPFTVYGLSLGLAIGGAVTHLDGRASYMTRLGDFPGSYRAFGLGGALVGGAGGVQLKNRRGVIITLQGPRAGLEFSANLSRVRFALD
jgi:hypothetical protein